MKTSQAGIDLIKESEAGKLPRLNAYLDRAGVPTIGWGTVIYKSGARVRLGETITLEQAEDLLAWQIHLKEIGVNTLLHPYVLAQNKFDALVSFTYNEGLGALRSSALLKKVRADHNDESIRGEFMRWDKVKKKDKDGNIIGYEISDGLLRRRTAEAEMYFQ